MGSTFQSTGSKGFWNIIGLYFTPEQMMTMITTMRMMMRIMMTMRMMRIMMRIMMTT